MDSDKKSLKNKAPRAPLRALYAGSFDPFTLGHAAIVSEALGFCEELIVALGKSGQKQPWLPLATRLEAIEEHYAAEPRVKVVAFEGLVVHEARRQGASVLLRGLRSGVDLSYEQPMALMNKELAPELSTVFLLAAAPYGHVSSSLVRELWLHSADLSSLLSPAFLSRLPKRG